LGFGREMGFTRISPIPTKSEAQAFYCFLLRLILKAGASSLGVATLKARTRSDKSGSRTYPTLGNWEISCSRRPILSRASLSLCAPAFQAQATKEMSGIQFAEIGEIRVNPATPLCYLSYLLLKFPFHLLTFPTEAVFTKLRRDEDFVDLFMT